MANGCHIGRPRPKKLFFNTAYSDILTADLFQASLSYWDWDSKRFISLEAPFHYAAHSSIRSEVLNIVYQAPKAKTEGKTEVDAQANARIQ